MGGVIKKGVKLVKHPFGVFLSMGPLRHVLKKVGALERNGQIHGTLGTDHHGLVFVFRTRRDIPG